MRCRRAKTAIVEWGLGLLASESVAELRLHLEDCPCCAADALSEARLVTDLSALRRPYPDRIDVRQRVLGEIARLSRVEREEVSARQLGWASAAAVAVGLALALTLLVSMPSLPQLAASARTAAGTAAQLWQGVVPVVLALLSVPLRLLGSLLELVSGLASLLRWLEPVAGIAAFSCCLAMATTITVVVWRDFTRGRTALLPKEH